MMPIGIGSSESAPPPPPSSPPQADSTSAEVAARATAAARVFPNISVSFMDGHCWCRYAGGPGVPAGSGSRDGSVGGSWRHRSGSSISERPEAHVVLQALPDAVQPSGLEYQEGDDHHAKGGVLHRRQL